MKKLYLYPLWLRIWHLTNALFMILLFISGISLHYSETSSTVLTFDTTIIIHNLSGIILTFNYLFFFILNFTSGNYKFYIPKIKNFIKEIIIQGRFYLIDIFDKEPHPFPPNEIRKFNPLQKLAYMSIMYGMVPLVIITGWMLMFPAMAPDDILGLGGVWPAAILHIVAGFIISLFTIGHLYLGTTGNTIGDLFTGIITGWHHAEEGPEEYYDEKISKFKPKLDKGKLLPSVLNNTISMSGAFVSLISFAVIIFLIILALFADIQNPYISIFTFLVLPIFLIFGAFLIFFGIFRENRILLRGSKKERRLPILDLNNTKHQVATIVFTLAAMLLLVFSGYGSFKAYQYTESDEFCGTLCHKVLEPEFTTSQNSPHSNVRCVECHIGSSAGWVAKSKISGLYRIYTTITDDYPKPIPTPLKNLRPAQETCEQCHSPKHFYNTKTIKRDYYLSDEANTHYNLEMSIKVGGGNIEVGNNEGIHWHMNLGNEITYIATDEEKQEIPWVKSRSLITGKETVYNLPGFKMEETFANIKNMKVMDCIDCHNRPTHVLNPPDKIVNLFMSLGKIDPSIPYIKVVSVSALEGISSNKKNAIKDINNYIWNFYKKKLNFIDRRTKDLINSAIVQLSNIYAKNYFPEMKVNWKNHPDNIGHLYSKGCYRCHDGKHVSPEGKILTINCEACHTFRSEAYQKDSLNTVKIVEDFLHPGGDDKNIKEQNCVFCHGAPKYRKALKISKRGI